MCIPIFPDYPGYLHALEPRERIHGEISSTPQSQIPMTFEEYSTLYSLSPLGPLGSRIDEWAEHYTESLDISSLQPLDFDDQMVEMESISRVAVRIGHPRFDEWMHARFGRYEDGNPGFKLHQMGRYTQLILEEIVALAWIPHINSGLPFLGPSLRHRWLHWVERFWLPTQHTTDLHPDAPPSVEAPTVRDATAEDALDFCPICLVPIEVGEPLMVLPCRTARGKHWFHPECSENWSHEKHRQACVYSCVQRLFSTGPGAPGEHHEYDGSFTFADSLEKQ